MNKTDTPKVQSKRSKNPYVPHVHLTWKGALITYLAGVMVFFLAKYLAS